MKYLMRKCCQITIDIAASANNICNTLIHNVLSRVLMYKDQQFFDLQGDCKLLYFRVLQN